MGKPIDALMTLADEYAHEASLNNEFDNHRRKDEARERLRQAISDALTLK